MAGLLPTSPSAAGRNLPGCPPALSATGSPSSPWRSPTIDRSTCPDSTGVSVAARGCTGHSGTAPSRSGHRRRGGAERVGTKRKGGCYDTYVLKATIEPGAGSGPTAGHVDRFDEALQTVARSITQVRLHERLLRTGGDPARPGRRRPALQALCEERFAPGHRPRRDAGGRHADGDPQGPTARARRDGRPPDRPRRPPGLEDQASLRPVAGPSNGCGGPAGPGSSSSSTSGTTTTCRRWPTCSAASPRT